MFPSPIWTLKYLRVTWKLSFTLISTRITSTKWFSYNYPLKGFWFFFLLHIGADKILEKYRFDFSLSSLNYLEINEIKLMYQHTSDTFGLQICGHNSDILGEKQV